MLFRGNQRTVKIKKGLYDQGKYMNDAEVKAKFETVSSNIGIKGEEERILLIYKQKGSIHAVTELFTSVSRPGPRFIRIFTRNFVFCSQKGLTHPQFYWRILHFAPRRA